MVEALVSVAREKVERGYSSSEVLNFTERWRGSFYGLVVVVKL